MTAKKCYKVVRLDNGFWKSASTDEAGIVINYHLGAEVFPKVKGSPIFAFKSLQFAKIFKGNSHRELILECEYTEKFETKRSTPRMIDWGLFDLHGPEWLRQRWEEEVTGESLELEEYEFEELPVGTILVKSLTPVTIVE